MIIETVLGNIDDFDMTGLKVEKVTLDHHDMAKPHQRLTTDSGEKIAVSLQHGEHLFNGAVLYRDDEKIIAVDMKPEDVLEIRPEGNRQWAKTAFNIGNMHHPAYIYDDRIVIPYDAILENLLNSIGVAFTRCERKLDGEKAAHVVGGHHHHHHHDDDHHEHVHHHSHFDDGE